MRVLTLFLIAGLVLAVTSQAWGIPADIPFRTSYIGPVTWHLSNWDEGTVYNGKLLNGSDAPLDTPISVAKLQKTGPGGTLAGKGDAWGVVRVETIFDAARTGPNSMTIGTTQLYGYGDQGTELVGLFYGRKDDTVTFHADGSQTIYSDPLGYVKDRVDLYIQPVGTAANWMTGMQGPNAALIAGKYPGIGTSLQSTLVLTGFVTPGFLNNGADGFLSTFTPSGNTGSGGFDMCITWDGGADLNLFHETPGIFPFMGGPGAPYTADVRLRGTITPTDSPLADPWLASTSDPAFMAVVPEPATMVLVALGGLGVLFGRKRK